MIGLPVDIFFEGIRGSDCSGHPGQNLPAEMDLRIWLGGKSARLYACRMLVVGGLSLGLFRGYEKEQKQILRLRTLKMKSSWVQFAPN